MYNIPKVILHNEDKIIFDLFSIKKKIIEITVDLKTKNAKSNEWKTNVLLALKTGILMADSFQEADSYNYLYITLGRKRTHVRKK